MKHTTLKERQLKRWERIELAVDLTTWSIVGVLALWFVSNL